MQTYDRPTPETDAFMLHIDDSEIDLGQVEGKLQQLECERDYARELLKNLEYAANLMRGAMRERPEIWNHAIDCYDLISSANVKEHLPPRSDSKNKQDASGG